MAPLIAAWMVAEGIIIYRSAKEIHAPPGPGQLLFSSGVFVMLGLLAEAPKARSLAATLGWGFVAAAALNLFGTGTGKLNSGANRIDDKTGSKKWPPQPANPTEIIPTGV